MDLQSLFSISFWLLLIGGFFFWLIMKLNKQKKFVSNDNLFNQNGVTVNYQDGSVEIGKHKFPVSKITGIRSSYTHRQLPAVLIEVDLIEQPVHTIPFNRVDYRDTFIQRLCVAIRKAGGPSFV
jgi:hypothetical protein